MKEEIQMALISCPECSKEVSDEAYLCIHCGFSLKKKKNIFDEIMKKKKILLVITSIVFVAIMAFVLFSSFVTREEKIAINDVRTLQEELLSPETIIIYEAYINFDYDGKQATIIRFGTKNILDDWVLISGIEKQYKSSYDWAVKYEGDVKISKNAGVASELTRIKDGADDWIKVNAKKIQKKVR